MKVIFTRHALQRISERGIDKGDIKSTLQKPDEITEIAPTKFVAMKKFSKKGLEVIFAEKIDQRIVITAYYL